MISKSNDLIAQYGGYASWNKLSNRIYFYHTLYSNAQDGRGDYKGFVIERIDVNNLRIDSLFFVPKTDLNLWCQACTVSPDEQDVLFAAAYGSPPQLNIWQINLQNREMKQITQEGGNHPSYNPTGDKIVYTNTNINEGGLWIMDRDGANKQRLTTKKR